jgi:hypothetical protein
MGDVDRPQTADTASGEAVEHAHASHRTSRGAATVGTVALNGDRVRNFAGEVLGRVEGIMLDPGRECIAYAVVSLDPALGTADKLLAVPWNALRVDTDNQCVILDASRDRLKTAPRFDRGHWPSLAESRWQSRVNKYYGVPCHCK